MSKTDISTTWTCPRCPHKHAPTALCPPAGVWLVLTLCPRCNATTETYCPDHRGRQR